MGGIAGIALAVVVVYCAGYNAGKQSIREKFSKLMEHDRRRK